MPYIYTVYGRGGTAIYVVLRIHIARPPLAAWALLVHSFIHAVTCVSVDCASASWFAAGQGRRAAGPRARRAEERRTVRSSFSVLQYVW